MMPALNPPNSLIVDAEKLLKELSVASSTYETEENWDMLDETMSLFKYVQTHKENGKVTVTQMQLIDAGILWEITDSYESAIDFFSLGPYTYKVH